MKNIKFIEYANELIFVKKSIATLLSQEQELKSKLKPFVTEDEALQVTGGKIYQYSEKQVKTFLRTDVLEFLENKFGVEVAYATDAYCTKHKNTSSRLHVRIESDD